MRRRRFTLAAKASTFGAAAAERRMTAETTSADKKIYTMRETIAALGRPRVAAQMALGLASGLPFLLTGATFGFWLRDEGTTLSAIGFLSWVGLAYSFKVFWAPLLDRAPAPFFARFGQRRGWTLFAQALVIMGLVCMAGVGVHGPGGLGAIGAFALVVAFASATQDIAIDAWRIEAAENADELGLFSSAYQLGYRTALIVTDALILICAQAFGWRLSYLLMAALMGAGVVATFFTPDPDRPPPVPPARLQGAAAGPLNQTYASAGLFAFAAAWFYWATHGGLGPKGDIARAAAFGEATATALGFSAAAVALRVRQAGWLLGAATIAGVVLTAFYSAIVTTDQIGGARIFWPVVAALVATALAAPPAIYGAVIGPFVAFFRAHGLWALVMLTMIALYRLPEFVIGPVAGPFYHDLGFEKAVVGAVRGTMGLAGAVLGIAAGGVFVLRAGLRRALIFGAFLQGLGVAAYALLTLGKPSLEVFGLVMASDNFGYAFSGVAFVAYMSSLTSVGYTATQYALMSSTYAILGKILKGFSGAAIDAMSHTRPLMEAYGVFYVGAGLIGLPALLLCFVVAPRAAALAKSGAKPF